MALRNIVKIGEPGEFALHSETRTVKRFDDRLKELAKDMLETMRDGNGIGLAAPQVGILKKLFVMNVVPEEGDFIIINPEILESSGEDIAYEGCLSLPHLYGKVKRKTTIKIRFQDLSGEFHELLADGLKARCIQHEMDHLDGVMFTEKMIGELVHESEFAKESEAESEQGDE